jgi:V8-like Glu-specific endopeptidase
MPKLGIISLAWPRPAVSSRVASVALVCALTGSFGCSSKTASGPSLPSFSDLTTAPAAIQKAALAVVRIETANEAATGSFISADGLLLTNNHVLGTAICPVEGCFAQLTFNFQRGLPLSQPQTVFVVPTAVSAGLDMAVVQVYSSQGGAKFAAPNSLTIASKTAAALETTHVTVVGHPEGDLKKWTSGEVFLSDGDWIYTTAYSLPGNSGSPFLDDDGELVGILHRGPTGEGLVSTNGVLTYSIGTPSSLLLAAMKAPLPSEMISVAAPTTESDVVANDIVYLNAHVSEANVTGGTTLDVLSALGTACDAALQGSYGTPDLLDAALQPCDDAMSWIHCQADVPGRGGSECPGASDLVLWQQRFTQMNAVTVAMNDQPYLDPISSGIASLQPTSAQGLAAGGSSLTQALAAAGAPLDLSIANYLAAFAVPSYQGTSIPTYVTNYAQVPEYQLNAGDAASAATWLAQDGLFTSSQAVAVVEALYADPTVVVGDKLYIETIEYQSGLVK